MHYTGNTLAACARPMIQLISEKYCRKGQYRKATLIGKYGPDIVMPNLLRKIADCPRWQPSA